MSLQIPYIQRLSEVVATVVRVSDMLEELFKEQDSVIGSLSIYTKDTLATLPKLVQGLLELQQERDLDLATKQGVV